MRDLCALDIYERAMQPYWSLQAEADRERLLRQIPITGKRRPGLFRKLITALGGGLVVIGQWFQKVGKIEPAVEVQFAGEASGVKSFEDL